MNINEILNSPESVKEAEASGKISNLELDTTTKGEEVGFCKIFDESGEIECVLFPKFVLENKDTLAPGSTLKGRAKIMHLDSPKKLFF